jgi:NADH-quinone oxidoreductase subunit B
MGACASSGGVFDAYATVQGIDRFLPVDVYVPGCPPRPEQLIQAVMDIQDRIKKTGTLSAKEFGSRTAFDGPRFALPQVPPGEAIVAPGNFATSTRLQEARPDDRR